MLIDIRSAETARYLLAEDRDALYVSFIGTKQRRDIMTNANIMQETLWPDLADDVNGAEPQVRLPPGTRHSCICFALNHPCHHISCRMADTKC